MNNNLVETDKQKRMQEIIEKYFQAWQTQSIDLIREIFSQDAVYDEKPGIENPLKGIEEIIDYWEYNPMSQTNINVEYSIIDYTENSIRTKFKADFDVREKHYEVQGVIEFTIEDNITYLKECFNVNKTEIS